MQKLVMAKANSQKTVARLSDYTNNTMQISPEQAIQDLQDFLRDNPDYDKVFLITVNTKDQSFDYVWMKGRMLNSEAIAVLHLCLDDMSRALNGEAA